MTGKRVHGEPHTSEEDRTRMAVASGKTKSVVVGPCHGPNYHGVAYRAAQPLLCQVPGCGAAIMPGALFTRRAMATAWGRGLLAVCVACGPVELADA